MKKKKKKEKNSEKTLGQISTPGKLTLFFFGTAGALVVIVV